MPIASGTVLGFVVGIVPGSAHIISSSCPNALEKRISSIPRSSARARSLASPAETANNAAVDGAFVPMLALGLRRTL